MPFDGTIVNDFSTAMRLAAKSVRENGWQRNALGDKGPRCAIGHILNAYGQSVLKMPYNGQNVALTAVNKFKQFLEETHRLPVPHTGLAYWNDHRVAGAEELATIFETAAQHQFAS